MTDNKPLTAGALAQRIEAIYFGPESKAYRDRNHRTIAVASELLGYKDDVLTRAQWPPGRPISEYKPEMGEVLVERIDVEDPSLILIQPASRIVGNERRFSRFWLLPTEGA